MGAAEDDDQHNRRPQAAGTEPDDALDDADDVRLLLAAISQRAGALLDNIECYQYRYAIHGYRVGWPDFLKPGQEIRDG